MSCFVPWSEERITCLDISSFGIADVCVQVPCFCAKASSQFASLKFAELPCCSRTSTVLSALLYNSHCDLSSRALSQNVLRLVTFGNLFANFCPMLCKIDPIGIAGTPRRKVSSRSVVKRSDFSCLGVIQCCGDYHGCNIIHG